MQNCKKKAKLCPFHSPRTKSTQGRSKNLSKTRNEEMLKPGTHFKKQVYAGTI